MKPVRSAFIRISLLLLALLLLAACQPNSPPNAASPPAPANAASPTAPANTAPTPPAQQALCNRDAANALAGKPRVTDDEAKRLTGAAAVRQIAPGDAVTKDYSESRVTIETDPANNQIVRASCG